MTAIAPVNNCPYQFGRRLSGMHHAQRKPCRLLNRDDQGRAVRIVSGCGGRIPGELVKLVTTRQGGNSES